MINPDNIQLEDLPEEYREVAEVIGLKAALDLVKRFQGCQLYVPKLKTITRQRLYRQMYNDYRTCGSFKRLAVRYNMSEFPHQADHQGRKTAQIPSPGRPGRAFLIIISP